MEPVAQASLPFNAATPQWIADDLAFLQTGIANVFFAGAPYSADRKWVLIDAGVVGFAGRIRNAANELYGPSTRPRAIVLTHGHFDHIGAAETLAEEWDVPIYVHELELPYLTGVSRYPPGDSSVGGGAMASLAWMYPNGPKDFSPRVQPLPVDGSVPGLDGWRWIHTPGHSPGHVAFFRESDKALVSGDAVTTVKQESALAVLRQIPALHGPPAYYTVNWEQARQSVHALAELEPATIAPGHGLPLSGPAVAEGLAVLDYDFEDTEIPRSGRYVGSPAVTGANGLEWAPGPRPASFAPLAVILLVILIGAFAKLAVTRDRPGRSKH